MKNKIIKMIYEAESSDEILYNFKIPKDIKITPEIEIEINKSL